MAMTMRYSLQLSSSKQSISRALDRWESLWNHVVDAHKTESDFLRGFNKHNLELCEFVRKLISAEERGHSDLRYLKVAPTDEMKHLHEFLRT